MTRFLAGGLAAALCGACAVRAPAPPGPPVTQPAPTPPGEAPATAPRPADAVTYRCGAGLALSVRAAQDTVEVDGLPQGPELLLRDAGGVTPQQTVFSNPRLRVEFGLGPDGREATLHRLQPPAPDLQCRRD
jgi:hypothetical protein